MATLFPILSDEELLQVDGHQELLLLKEQYPDPVNPEDTRHPMAMYRVMLASRRAVAQAERRHFIVGLLISHVRESDPLHALLTAALRETGAG